MKILQINSVYNYGSTGKIVKNIHNYLLTNNIDSYVIYARKCQKDALDKNVIQIYSPIGTALHASLAVIFDTHGLHSIFTTKKIISTIEKIKPDIIHLHNIHGFYLNYPMLFSYIKQHNIKTIWTLHDCWSYTGYCAYYDYNQCDNWHTKNCKKCKYHNVYPYRILSHSYKNLDIKKACYDNLNIDLITCSKWLKEEVSKSILQDKKCTVINNTIDTTNFYYQENDFRKKYNLENKFIILGVANYWTVQKGFNEFLKLANKLSDKYQIVMIGLNKKQMKKMPNNILGIERTDIDTLRKWYSCADVFLNCTLEDNYPTVNLEAKTCGLPIITYNTGGSIEIIGPQDHIVDKYDIDEIISLLETKTFNRNTFKKDNDMCQEYLNYYSSII